ncbi:Uncharacterized protein SVXHr_2483 [Halorhabdus sp. SVX81]|nr:Uncharacterized protein SVXHr_2483 [Halorhabdus sp. SVX81]WEL22687.1 Uncharacterized protein HBNXHr_2648 [Halorhabdus sp. BNX81]
MTTNDETYIIAEMKPRVMVDPVLVGIVVVVLAFVFFVYLFVRRIATGFSQGMREGKRGG